MDNIFARIIGWYTSLLLAYMYANLYAFCGSHAILSYEFAIMPSWPQVVHFILFAVFIYYIYPS